MLEHPDPDTRRELAEEREAERLERIQRVLDGLLALDEPDPPWFWDPPAFEPQAGP